METWKVRHSVEFISERCVGCTACMRVCPTEAIRIRKGKARVRSALCIDCGECLRVCRHRAVGTKTDTLEEAQSYRYRIAVPEVSIYGQFVKDILPSHIHEGILSLGFDHILEISRATEATTYLMREYMKRYRGPKPVISSFCPVVVRLIQIRFPDLLHLVIPVDSVLELATKDLKAAKSKELGIPVDSVGAFYLVACPARARTIHSPDIGRRTYIDGAIAINSIYRDLLFAIKEGRKHSADPFQPASGIGIGWGALGGEKNAVGIEDSLTVSGIQNLLRIIEEIDNDMLSDINFVECRACYGGCAGGPLMVDNPYRGKAKIEQLTRRFADCTLLEEGEIIESSERYFRHFEKRFDPMKVEPIADDPATAIERMSMRDKILESLPGIDCGSCGSPNCKALADDIVRGEANIRYCLFKLKDEYLKVTKGG